MLHGLMQDDYQLTLQHVLQRGRFVYGDSLIVTQTDAGPVRSEFGELAERVDRLSAGLSALGVRPADRVATLAWNTQQHLELYLSVPSVGAVLHTLNLRLSADQLTYIVNHAEDRVVFVEDNLVGLVEPLLERLPKVSQWVVIGDGDTGSLDPVVRYDELLSHGAGYSYPRLDERQAAALCYTSGTTGHPKGVLYSHRSSLLHAFGALGADSFGLSCNDRAMPVVPMFHANAWGIPYAAVLTGADLVLPGRFIAAETIAQLIESERVTLSGAVPTVWWDLLRHADPHEPADARVRRGSRPTDPDARVRGAARRACRSVLGADRGEPARVARPPADVGVRGRALELPRPRGPGGAAHRGEAD